MGHGAVFFSVPGTWADPRESGRRRSRMGGGDEPAPARDSARPIWRPMIGSPKLAKES